MGKKRHFIIWLPTPNNMLRDVFEAFFNAWKFAYKYMQVAYKYMKAACKCIQLCPYIQACRHLHATTTQV